MSAAPCGPEAPQDVAGGHSTVQHDRRRPGRQDVAPDLLPLLRGQGPKPADVAEGADEVIAACRDDLSNVSGIMRGLGIAILGWVVVGILILY